MLLLRFCLRSCQVLLSSGMPSIGAILDGLRVAHRLISPCFKTCNCQLRTLDYLTKKIPFEWVSLLKQFSTWRFWSTRPPRPITLSRWTTIQKTWMMPGIQDFLVTLLWRWFTAQVGSKPYLFKFDKAVCWPYWSSKTMHWEAQSNASDQQKMSFPNVTQVVLSLGLANWCLLRMVTFDSWYSNDIKWYAATSCRGKSLRIPKRFLHSCQSRRLRVALTQRCFISRPVSGICRFGQHLNDWQSQSNSLAMPWIWTYHNILH